MTFTPWQLLLKNGREVTIRNLAESDAEEMIRFMNEIDTESRFLTREPGEFTYTPDEERAIIRARSEDPGAIWLIAEQNGRILASCNIARVMNRKRFLHRAGIGIVVRKECWGQGIGRAIMRECISFARKAGYEQVELDVVADNTRAIALYESLGFKLTGMKPNEMKYPDGSYADGCFMMLKF